MLKCSADSIFSSKRLTNVNEGDEITPNGIIQAKLLALRLKEAHLDEIYCSDMLIANETLKEIIQFHDKSKVIFTSKIRDRNFGVMKGKPIFSLNELIEVFDFH